MASFKRFRNGSGTASIQLELKLLHAIYIDAVSNLMVPMIGSVFFPLGFRIRGVIKIRVAMVVVMMPMMVPVVVSMMIMVMVMMMVEFGMVIFIVVRVVNMMLRMAVILWIFVTGRKMIMLVVLITVLLAIRFL